MLLTQLPNRALYNDRLDQALASAERNGTSVAVLLMDLDNFKYVNDTLGHHIGDLVLRAVTARLEGVVKRRADTVARLGGDEFAVVLPGDDAVAAQTVAKAILRSLEIPMVPAGQNLDVRASIGVALYPEHGRERSILLRHADVAMYAAKRNKLGYAVWNDDYDEYSRERLVALNELRRAVDQNQLTLHYQPKVHLNRIGEHHAEALIRWQHPTRGLVAPNDFIPFAEQTGHIRVITRWVLARAIAQCAQWRSDGLPMNVSMNISAYDVMDAELPDHVAALLQRNSCAAHWITLEVTESAILDNPDHGIKRLQRLNELGCGLAIDDSARVLLLAYLRRLPVRELKLDKSFVVGMMGETSDALIVRSTIDLAAQPRIVRGGRRRRRRSDAREALRARLRCGPRVSVRRPPRHTSLRRGCAGPLGTRAVRKVTRLRRVV